MRRMRFVSSLASLLTLAAFAGAAGAQPSSVCQFAVATVFATEIELQEASKALRRGERLGRTSCAAERGRIRDLRQRLRLSRNYLESRCTR